MKTGLKVFLGFIACLIVILAIGLGLGWFNVFATKTVGKAQQNANRAVFEQTQSYVEGKRQELIKDYHEWINADKDSKKSIEAIVRASFASFDESKIEQPELYSFLKKCKYQ
jgi:uncharacterized protein HemX